MSLLFVVVAVIVVALIFDFTNGFHDSANAMAGPIATGALKPRTAVIIAAVLNVVTVDPDDAGFVTLFPCGQLPTTSSLNHSTGGMLRANNAITKLSSSGSVCVYTLSASNIVLDLAGYLT